MMGKHTVRAWFQFLVVAAAGLAAAVAIVSAATAMQPGAVVESGGDGDIAMNGSRPAVGDGITVNVPPSGRCRGESRHASYLLWRWPCCGSCGFAVDSVEVDIPGETVPIFLTRAEFREGILALREMGRYAVAERRPAIVFTPAPTAEIVTPPVPKSEPPVTRMLLKPNGEVVPMERDNGAGGITE